MDLRIVAIDDDKKITVFLKKELEKSGNIVFTANNGTAGLELVKKKNPDLVICDMLIPGIHGAELARQLRADPLLTDLKIILMTAVYKKISWLVELKSLADGFLDKPFGIPQVTELINKVMVKNKKNRREDGK